MTQSTAAHRARGRGAPQVEKRHKAGSRGSQPQPAQTIPPGSLIPSSSASQSSSQASSSWAAPKKSATPVLGESERRAAYFDLKRSGQLDDLNDDHLTNARVDEEVAVRRAIASTASVHQAVPSDTKAPVTPEPTEASTGQPALEPASMAPQRPPAGTPGTAQSTSAGDGVPDPKSQRKHEELVGKAWDRLGTDPSLYPAREAEAARELQAGKISKSLFDAISLRSAIAETCASRFQFEPLDESALNAHEARRQDKLRRMSKWVGGGWARWWLGKEDSAKEKLQAQKNRLAAVEGIARKCEASRTGKPRGYGIASGADFRALVRATGRRQSTFSLLNSVLDYMQAAFMSTVAIDLVQKLYEEVGARLPLFDSGETEDDFNNLFSLTLLTVGLLDIARRGIFPGEYKSTLPPETKALPRDKAFLRRAMSIAARQMLSIPEAIRSPWPRTNGLVQYIATGVFGGLSSWLGSLSAGDFGVPAWVNASGPAQDWELAQIDLARQDKSRLSLLREWAGSLAPCVAWKGVGGPREFVEDWARDTVTVVQPYRLHSHYVIAGQAYWEAMPDSRPSPAGHSLEVTIGLHGLVVVSGAVELYALPRGDERNEAARALMDEAQDLVVSDAFRVKGDWDGRGRPGYTVNRASGPSRRPLGERRQTTGAGWGDGGRGSQPSQTAGTAIHASADDDSRAAKRKSKQKRESHAVGRLPDTATGPQAAPTPSPAEPHEFYGPDDFHNFEGFRNYLVHDLACEMRANTKGSHFIFGHAPSGIKVSISRNSYENDVPKCMKDIEVFLQEIWDAGVRSTGRKGKGA